MLPILRFGICWSIVILAAFAFPETAAAGPLALKGNRWQVSIEPETLRVTATPAGGPPFVVSSAAPAPLVAKDIKHSDRGLSWLLPTPRLAVDMRLDGDDVLVVRFEAAAPGSFTWPIIDSDAVPSAYILPMFEGLYVPAADERWGRFLTSQGAMTTTAGLSMPFWGFEHGRHTLTYILTNPYNNELEFRQAGGRIGLTLTHSFSRRQKLKQFGFRIHLGDASPVTPARLFRRHLIDSGEFVSLKQKIEKTPDAAKLLGAPHVYLWGAGLISRDDIGDYKQFARLVVESTQPTTSPVSRRLWGLMGEECRKLLADIPAKPRADNHEKGQVTEELSRILKLRDFYEPAAWQGIVISAEAQSLIDSGAANLSDVQIARRNCLLLQAALPKVLKPVDTWGDGFSVKLVQMMADAGLDRLWLGSPEWDGLAYHDNMVREAISRGYLIGPYDSYHSIHASDDADTWETAQFSRELYESGGVLKADGTPRKGFKQKGFMLSPSAARPQVEQRVSRLMNQFHCNSWFVDCDAFGEVFDDYSRDHPATQQEDAGERLSRMAWICDTYGAVIGSEGGSAYAAPVIHFAHGMMTPVIGWDDPALMKDRKSQYFLGGYYPNDQPAIFFKQVPMKAEHRRVYADPRFRLPLYEIVFHDSVVATHQWGYASLKFDDPDHTRGLLELLYNVPPLYHLNLAEWRKRSDQIRRQFDFFSPLHREAALLPMTDFEWLTHDRMVQRTRFGQALELVANFGDQPYTHEKIVVPPKSLVASWTQTGATRLYTGAAP